MLRIAYALTVVMLIGASAVAGTSIESRRDRLGDTPNFALLKLKLAG